MMTSTAGAILSLDRRYRYSLWRSWTEGEGTVAFIGLNSSTADETDDDPTIRRCVGFAKTWGYRGLVMLNLFALRSTDPRELQRDADPVGPSNDHTLVKVAAETDLVVAAWGNHGGHLNRDQCVAGIIGAPLLCLAANKSGSPKHPLYVRGDAILQPWPALQAYPKHPDEQKG